MATSERIVIFQPFVGLVSLIGNVILLLPIFSFLTNLIISSSNSRTGTLDKTGPIPLQLPILIKSLDKKLFPLSKGLVRSNFEP